MQQQALFGALPAATDKRRGAPKRAPSSRLAALEPAAAPRAGGGAKPMTEQMRRIVGSDATRLVVRAGAGTGKTTTSVHYAEQRRGEGQILYLSFSALVREHGKKIMPPHVLCKTKHGLATSAMYQQLRRMQGDGFDLQRTTTSAEAAARCLGVSVARAHAALQTIAHWCYSVDERLGVQHVPASAGSGARDSQGIVSLADDLWQVMQRAGAPGVRMPHDGVLKLYQLSRPTIRGFSRIMVDESQDLNACMFDILRRQSLPLLMIGDSAQQIFIFRGSVDALAALEGARSLELTRSFRFGPGVAALANVLLRAFRPADGLQLEGAGPKTSFRVDPGRGHAVICRTNAMLFERAVDALRGRRRFHFCGGLRGYRFEQLADAAQLALGRCDLVRDPELRGYASLGELEHAAETLDDGRLRQIVRVVHRFGADIPRLVDEISQRHVDLADDAVAGFDGVCFATAHKSKGLEFDQVVLGDDFVRLCDDRRGSLAQRAPINISEINVLYVALTRARLALEPSASFVRWLEENNVDWQGLGGRPSQACAAGHGRLG